MTSRKVNFRETAKGLVNIQYYADSRPIRKQTISRPLDPDHITIQVDSAQSTDIMKNNNASPLGEAASEETLVTIPEEWVTIPIEPESKIIGTEQTIHDNGKSTGTTVKATRNTDTDKVIPTVPILAITSILLVVLGALFFAFSARRINAAANYGYEPHPGHYALMVISAVLLAFGIIFAFPCCVPIIERIRPRFRGSAALLPHPMFL